MDAISLEELIMAVRRQSQGFSRGTSGYRGVTHHPTGAVSDLCFLVFKRLSEQLGPLKVTQGKWEDSCSFGPSSSVKNFPILALKALLSFG